MYIHVNIHIYICVFICICIYFRICMHGGTVCNLLCIGVYTFNAYIRTY